MIFKHVWIGLYVIAIRNVHFVPGKEIRSHQIYANETETVCMSFTFDTHINSVTIKHKYAVLIAFKKDDDPTLVKITSNYIQRIDYSGNIDERNISFCLKNLTYNDSGVYLTDVDDQNITLYILGTPTTPIIKGSYSKPIGSSVDISCSANSQTLPSLVVFYIWKINGSRIVTGEKYKFGGEGNNKLTIRIVQKKDKYNNYQCMATEGHGHTSISNATKIDPQYPPTLRLNPSYNPYYVIQGIANIAVFCEQVDANPKNSTFVWTQSSNLGPHLNNLGPHLNISSIQTSDEGTYTCSADNGIGNHTISFRLDVQYPPLIEIQNQPIEEGNDLNVTCEVSANPVPDIQWKSKIYPDVIQNTTSLIFSSIQRNSSGIYICQAYNTLTPSGKNNKTGFATENITIDVLYGPGNSVRLSHGSSIYVTENEIMHPITCSAVCNPDCSYTWWRNSTRIIQNAIFQIEHVTRGTGGTYICVAMNEIGNTLRKSSASLNLLVQYQPSITKLYVERGPVQLEGSTIQMKCDVDSFPAADVTWIKFNFNEQTELKGNLYRIQNATCHDTANYTCTASNGIKSNVSRVINLFVKCSPSSEVEQIRIFYVKYNDSLSISAIMYAYPTPNITWLFISNDTYSILEETDESVHITTENHIYRHLSSLTRSYLQAQEFGIYVAWFQNEIGEKRMEFSVLPQRVPDKPSNVSVRCIGYDKANVSWVSGYNIGKNQNYLIVYRTENGVGVKNEIYDLKMKQWYIVDGLKKNTLYYFHMLSANEYEHSVSTSEISCKTADVSMADQLFLIGAIGGTLFGAVLMCVVTGILIYNHRRNHKKETSGGSAFITGSHMSIVSEDGMRDNILYESAGPDFVMSDLPGGSNVKCDYAYADVQVTNGQKNGFDNSSALSSFVQKSNGKTNINRNVKDVFAQVQQTKEKQTNKNNPSALYAQVQKKPKTKSNKSGTGYESSDVSPGYTQDCNVDPQPGSSNSRSDETLQPLKDKKPGKTNKDGLLYADLELDLPKSAEKVTIYGLENKTDYAEIDITKSAKPLSSKSDEQVERPALPTNQD